MIVKFRPEQAEGTELSSQMANFIRRHFRFNERNEAVISKDYILYFKAIEDYANDTSIKADAKRLRTAMSDLGRIVLVLEGEPD